MSPQSSPPRAFISSTSIDLAEYRQEVVETCLSMGYVPVGMQHWPAQDADAEEVCLREVDGADVFIGIYAFRYGWIPPGQSVSITELEYQRAVDRKKPRLLFLMDENYTGWPPSKVETGEGGNKLKAFKQRIENERVRSTFTTPQNLGGWVFQALRKHAGEAVAGGRIPLSGNQDPPAHRAEADAMVGQRPEADCPYRDLRAFQESDKPFFFGRDAFTSKLVDTVERHRFVAVVGASGSGKSSIVQAGLIPALRQSGGWLVGIVRPGPEPWRSLAGCLYDLLEGKAGDGERTTRQMAVGDLAGELAKGPAGGGKVDLSHLVQAILARYSGRRRLLLLVDQWEELYTYKKTSAKTARRFADVLIAATQGGALTVVLTLRADFTDRAVDEHRPLCDRLQEASVLVGAMTRAEREQAIVGPARAAGIGFEPELVDRLLDDVGDEPGNLPLLEFCLTQLYARRDAAGRMCQAAYKALGGVQGAIVQRADSVIDKLAAGNPEREVLARDIFLQLVQLGEGSPDTRRRAPLDDFRDAERAVVSDLVNARLLVTSRDPGSGRATVEVAHEALIRRWPRLGEWLRQDRDDLHLRREIGRAKDNWVDHAESDTYRWPDERVILEIAPALRRLTARFPLSDSERRFLGPTAEDELRAQLDDPATTQARRAAIGDRLALLPDGDRRPGVGLRADGVPDIAWHAIPGGEVRLEIDAKGPWKWLHGRPSFRVEPFHIARYPVTAAQWRPFVAAPDGYDALVRQPIGLDPEPQRVRDNQPATQLTWFEAMAYCRWLSGLLGYPVRLPTEWEWQQAASGGEPANDYPWGDWREGCANTYESGLGRVTAVGLHPAGQSAQGVLDLAGNVWEWCLNEFDSPKSVAEGSDARRVVRGGSWYGNRVGARCAFRGHYHPGYRDDFVGFRVWCVSPIF